MIKIDGDHINVEGKSVRVVAETIGIVTVVRERLKKEECYNLLKRLDTILLEVMAGIIPANSFLREGDEENG